jgi:sialate O-acetylesterase
MIKKIKLPMKLITRVTFSLFFVPFSLIVKADVTLPKLFQSNMVLQRDKPCNIWGTADNGEVVNISFANKNYSVKTLNEKWEITGTISRWPLPNYN